MSGLCVHLYVCRCVFGVYAGYFYSSVFRKRNQFFVMQASRTRISENKHVFSYSLVVEQHQEANIFHLLGGLEPCNGWEKTFQRPDKFALSYISHGLNFSDLRVCVCIDGMGGYVQGHMSIGTYIKLDEYGQFYFLFSKNIGCCGRIMLKPSNRWNLKLGDSTPHFESSVVSCHTLWLQVTTVPFVL